MRRTSVALTLLLLFGCAAPMPADTGHTPADPRSATDVRRVSTVAGPSSSDWSLPQASGEVPKLPAAIPLHDAESCAVGFEHVTVPLKLSPNAPPFAYSTEALGARIRLHDTGALVDAGPIRAWTEPAAFDLHPQRQALLGGVLVVYAKMKWNGKANRAAVGVSVRLSESGQTVSGDFPCNAVKQSFKAFGTGVRGYFDRTALYAQGHTTATQVAATFTGGQRYAVPENANVFVAESKGNMLRLAFELNEGLLLGWAPASTFVEDAVADLGGGGTGEGIGLCGYGGTIGHPEGRVRCPTKIPLIAEQGETRRVVGERSGDLNLVATGDPSQWTEVVIHDLALTDGSRIVVRTADLATCEPDGDPPPRYLPKPALARGC